MRIVVVLQVLLHRVRLAIFRTFGMISAVEIAVVPAPRLFFACGLSWMNFSIRLAIYGESVFTDSASADECQR
jgi:hypothetical protein